MKIQKILFTQPPQKSITNNQNPISFERKYVQPDSFINAPKRKKKSDRIDLFSVANRIATEKRNQSDIISVATRIAKERNDKINEYVNQSKKELKNLQKTAKAHKKQCLGILKKAEKLGYAGTINCDDYNLTFGTIDPKTNKPSIINIWDEGRLVQQYNINSFEPFNIEVHDCELKTFSEDFTIVNGELAVYKSHNKKNDIVKIVVPTSLGFYKVEGELHEREDIIKKSRELQYVKDKKYPSTYSEYDNNGAHHYQFDNKQRTWVAKNTGELNMNFNF